MLEDQKYIKALRDKDPVLCQEIYVKFLPTIVKRIIRKDGTIEQAKEVFQDALLVIIQNSRSEDFKLKKSFEAYLWTICKYKFIDLCRKQKKYLRNEEGLRLNSETFFDSAEVDQLLKKETQLNLLWKGFEKLADDCKKIIKGKLEGLSTAEIMKQINFTKSPNAFFVKRFDCMRKLRKLIEQHPEYRSVKI